ncbi:hypothetical protein EPA93_38210 [Ktedonosporobacter rubrisoli]|uniref:Uncharacterized protein n=1 Tax=Ktedonosporobacter rubrisoli TaxID=2509675 RepID=A0A4P6K0K4_KTERU|nr:hypothetical protein [Ktedonosporobacter rubrisoli]QBD81495.1 hypothetical protein EPA93_38210 [Ktedonosporobacter rubrisoli]
MQQQRQQHNRAERRFTASEVATFEYCPLIWWHECFEPAVQADTEELFARLVELEHEHGPQAPALPEYQMIEQLLLRRGAFEEEPPETDVEEDDEFEEFEEERAPAPGIGNRTRSIAYLAVALLVLAVALMGISLLLPKP